MNTYFAARGWILLLPLVVILMARLASDAALKPEWLIYVAAAASLRLWAGAHLGTHGNSAQAEAPQLAHTGPYRLSRNPLYVANILAAAGLILYANALPLPFALALIALVIVHHMILVLHEERALRALHGEAYQRYYAHAPRWWGLMRPRGLDESASKTNASVRDHLTATGLLQRQGRNLAYLAACTIILWAAARFA